VAPRDRAADRVRGPSGPSPVTLFAGYSISRFMQSPVWVRRPASAANPPRLFGRLGSTHHSPPAAPTLSGGRCVLFFWRQRGRARWSQGECHSACIF